MVRRHLLAATIGALLGGALGVGALQGFRVGTTPTLALFVSAGVGAVVVVLIRTPIWRQRSSIESLLYALLGLALGAGAELLLARFVDGTLPFRIPPLPAGARLTEQPAVYGPIVGALVGLLVGTRASEPKSNAPEPSKPAADAEPVTAPTNERA